MKTCSVNLGKMSFFMFHGTKKVIQVWKDIRVSECLFMD